MHASARLTAQAHGGSCSVCSGVAALPGACVKSLWSHPRLDPAGPRDRLGGSPFAFGATTPLDSSWCERGIGRETRSPQSNACTATGCPVWDLSVEPWPLISGVVDLGHAQQAQQPVLEPAQLGREHHRREPPNLERVALQLVKQVDQSAGRGPATLATLGVQRQAGDGLPLHGPTQLAFQQRLSQQRQKIDTEQGLYPTGLFKINRGHLE